MAPLMWAKHIIQGDGSMKCTIENEILTVFPEGRITSDNAPALTDEVSPFLEREDFSKIIVDASKLKYISSAGLRLVLKLIKTKRDTRIINVSHEVYDIFDTTGFTEMIPVELAMRKIDISGAEKIGGGYHSRVYRLDNETIVKVYVNGTSLENINREMNLAKKAFIAGVPCAITYDVVSVGEYYGVVFEAINAGTLLDYLVKNPDRLQEVTERYAAFLKEINSQTIAEGTVPDAKEQALEKLDFVREDMEPEIYDKVRAILLKTEKKDNVVHADCHLGNIMLQDKELVLIDMDTAVMGDSVYEFAAIFCTYKAFEMHEPGNVKKFLGLEGDLISRLFDRTFDIYFSDLSEEEKAAKLELIKIIAWAHMLFWVNTYQKDNREFFDFCYEHLKKAI